MKKFYKGDITPSDNTIFVFGSNTQGRHGLGNAKIARDLFGAINGQAEGLQGSSYGLVTKDLTVRGTGTPSVSWKDIVDGIKRLYAVAESNPDKLFKIAYRHKTKKSLCGYTGYDMISMFSQAGKIPENIVFSEEWKRSNFLGVFEDDPTN